MCRGMVEKSSNTSFQVVGNRELMQSKRYEWIDFAKGIGIILVIYGHIYFRPGWLNVWLCSFHMPLFFFLAGLTFKVEKYQSFAILIRTKFNQLIIPYFIFAFVQWLWTVAKQVVLAREALDIGYLCKQFVGIFLQIRTTSFGPGVWFIPCIFCAYILLFLICTFASGSRVRLSISALTCLLIGYYYCTFINLKLPWG